MRIIPLSKMIIMPFIVLILVTPFTRAVEIDFNRQIRPILSENCFQCHGPDQTHRKGNYRLDTKEGIFAVGKSGSKNILVRDAKNSEFFHRIEATDQAIMPPIKSGKKLNADQIKLIQQWINEGANYGEHWAFVAPKSSAVPAVTNKQWIKNPIDAFVLNKLDLNNIKPSPQASKEILIRRLTLDLIGLPPISPRPHTST